MDGAALPIAPHLAPRAPAMHLAPPTGWMNDPNGLSRIGETWHAYYQHHPHSDRWGPMHWRHATSADLLRWCDEGIVLAPDHLGAIFSGSIVVDHDDTAGFGSGAVVAIFTHATDDLQRQSLAISTDGAVTFQPYAGNPVLTGTAPDFRDPHVKWVDGGWTMCLAVGDHIEMYRSSDLRTWTCAGLVTADLPGAGVWECPNLVRVPRRRRAGEPDSVWVLLWSVSAGGPNGGSGTVWMPGAVLDGVFASEGPVRRYDQGPDCYATQTFHGVDGHPVAMSWMNSVRIANDHPSSGRRGVLSIPRRLELIGEGDELALCGAPAVDLASIGRPVGRHYRSRAGAAARVTCNGAMRLRVVALETEGASIDVEIDAAGVVLNRTVPGFAELTGSFHAALDGDGHDREVDVLVDHGTIEVFAGSGRVVMSALAFVGTSWALAVEGDAHVEEIVVQDSGKNLR